MKLVIKLSDDQLEKIMNKEEVKIKINVSRTQDLEGLFITRETEK